jgi:hypothetical protein
VEKYPETQNQLTSLGRVSIHLKFQLNPLLTYGHLPQGRTAEEEHKPLKPKPTSTAFLTRWRGQGVEKYPETQNQLTSLGRASIHL